MRLMVPDWCVGGGGGGGTGRLANELADTVWPLSRTRWSGPGGVVTEDVHGAQCHEQNFGVRRPDLSVRLAVVVVVVGKRTGGGGGGRQSEAIDGVAERAQVSLQIVAGHFYLVVGGRLQIGDQVRVGGGRVRQRHLYARVIVQWDCVLLVTLHQTVIDVKAVYFGARRRLIAAQHFPLEAKAAGRYGPYLRNLQPDFAKFELVCLDRTAGRA
ncbi:hypothetical protein BpHYR1_030548 [Brachionus plicatilis]|uniref:Uncharacterized protein n=1 Tax=Brachionus plicatilis TaxID=10195 RepID=A0A3M7RJV8_BRAPC|nr:hypothetical protein BpHYR1_030548 [Brachionus plicatilis]